MAMWQMHRPWARRTVAPEGGQTPFPLGFAPGPPHYWPRYFLLSQLARPFALCPLRIALDLRRCDHVYPRWGGHNPSSRARLTGSLIGSEPPQPPVRGSDLLSQIETFVTLCGMVGLRAKVLGQMGWTTSPYQRACALSCPSLAIYRPGYPSGYLGFMFGVRAAGPHIREATKPGKLESVRRHSYL